MLIMGVSGSGKSTLGRMLSQRIGVPLLEGDDFHSAANKEKLKKGEPLTDEDRFPWIISINNEIIKMENQNLILACSALKQNYRKLLMQNRRDWYCIFLKGSKELIQERLYQRKGHFFNPILLENQFEILEEPKNALVLNIEESVEHLLKQILEVVDN